MDEQYAKEAMPVGYAANALGGQIHTRRLDITLRQNIDERIKQATAAVKELEETKDRMEKSGILDMRIDDIRRAMQF